MTSNTASIMNGATPNTPEMLSERLDIQIQNNLTSMNTRHGRFPGYGTLCENTSTWISFELGAKCRIDRDQSWRSCPMWTNLVLPPPCLILLAHVSTGASLGSVYPYPIAGMDNPLALFLKSGTDCFSLRLAPTTFGANLEFFRQSREFSCGYQRNFEAADLAWLATGASTDNKHKLDRNDTFFPELVALRDSLPLAKNGGGEMR
ncbi:hypothetical protein B0H14DRAFT_2564012 [Mycena olivaceomarginata]|nr:hypothetical protein B0H14DRAFT_2564012 [Mycena olivaceomarginata]